MWRGVAAETASPRNTRYYFFIIDQTVVIPLPLHQEFERRRLANAISGASDIDELKSVALDLLNLYYQQKKASADLIDGKMG